MREEPDKLRMPGVGLRPAQQHGLCQQGLSPQGNESDWVQVHRVKCPKSHAIRLLAGRFSFRRFRFDFQSFSPTGDGDPHRIPNRPIGKKAMDVVDTNDAVLVDRDDEIPFFQTRQTRWSPGIDRHDLDGAI